LVVFAANGYCHSEAIVAVYLQKKESAKRAYASVVHSKTKSDGYKDQGILCLNISVMPKATSAMPSKLVFVCFN